MSAARTMQQKLRQRAKEFFHIGIKAVEPSNCVFNELAKKAPALPSSQGRLFLIAIGKAAGMMMKGAQDYLRQSGYAAHHCFLVTDHSNFAQNEDCECFSAGHPVPDADGIRAARRLLEILDNMGEEDTVFAFISGGGSALLPCPPDGISLEDKIVLSQLLLKSGIDIEGANLIRQQFSLLKGAGLVRRAAPARVLGFLLSDVPNNDSRIIASGLTALPLGTADKAISLAREWGFWDDLPNTMQEHLQTKKVEPSTVSDDVENILVGSNRMMVEAIYDAAFAAGYEAHPIWEPVVGNVGSVAKLIYTEAKGLFYSSKPVALVCGGETTVHLGNVTGQGGRNQELALLFAMHANHEDFPMPWVFLSGGSDGRDGPTDAAGGLVDGGSFSRIYAAGLSPEALLENHDSYRALDASGDLLLTGATGTNVADVQILLAAP